MNEVKLLSFVAFIFLLASPFNMQRLVSETTEETDMGTLAGDVQNGALLIQNYILQMANDAIKKETTQALIDKAKYTYEKKDGEAVIRQVKEGLKDYFAKKKIAAKRIAEKAVELYDKMYLSQAVVPKTLSALDPNVYRDADIRDKLPVNMQFSPYFKRKVSLEQSAVKITDEVPRDDANTIRTVNWTAGLESVFIDNHKQDEKTMRWQYFGSVHGVARFFPGREWDTNFAGFYTDYDPRMRPWYIAATSGPKDVVVIIDCRS